MITCIVFFFFSSRRRHTRCSRDWSSDVCSSDLAVPLTRYRTVSSAFVGPDRCTANTAGSRITGASEPGGPVGMPPSVATLSTSEIVTTVRGDDSTTLMRTRSETVEAPFLSVAFAVSTYSPGGTLDHVSEKFGQNGAGHNDGTKVPKPRL